MNTQSVESEKDEVAKELQDMIDEAFGEAGIDPIANQNLMTSLSRYIAHRDHRVWEHAYRLGENNGRKQRTG